MYFRKIPNIYYTFDINDEEVLRVVKDISYNVRIRKEILQNITLYDEYDIQEGETPEIIAAKVYGSSQYHWVIMLANQRYDYINDFPMTEKVLVKYVQEKYGDPFAIHHYENSDGFVVMPDYIGATPVSNYEHERKENEKKRRIKLIAPRLVNQIISEYMTI